VIIKYIQLLLLPINLHLDYDYPISDTFFEIGTLLSFLVLLSLVVLAIFSFKKYRIISFGIFWFFLTLSIESSFIPITDVIFEHRTYLPSFGFFLILTSGIYLLLWNKYKYFAIFIFVIIIASDSYLTYERNNVWKDEFSLWNDNAEKTPNLPRALVNRGVAYGNLGQWDKAIADYSKAIGINPEYTDGYYDLGVAYGNLGQWDREIACQSKAIEIDPNYMKAYYGRGSAYGNLGQLDKTIADYSKAIGIYPKYTEAYNNRGLTYATLGQMEKAINDFSSVIRFDPNNARAYSNRGIAYAKLGQLEQAIADFSRSIEIQPVNVIAYSNRGISYANLGQLEKAITDFSSALEIDPKNSVAYNNREVAYRKLQGSKK
jgi:tetratricopeptide (TPR) repeat protein